MKYLVIFALLICVGLITYYYMRDPVLRQDVRDVGHDVQRGVKDTYQDTKDAVKDAVK